MKKILFAFLLCIFLAPQAFAAAGGPSASVVIHEDTINNYLAAVGTLKGKGKHKGVKYTWKVKGAKIKIDKNNATLFADASVKSGEFTQGSKVKGKLDMIYDNNKNLIKIQLKELKFNVYIKIFGAKVKVTTLDLAKYFKPRFEFAGPQPIQKEIIVDMPDGKKRHIDVSSHNHRLALRQNKIIVDSDVKFTPRPSK